MKLISNRTGAFLTGTVLADTVMSYNLKLSEYHRVDLVDIPFVGSDGYVVRAQFIVGWMTDTVAVSSSVAPDELIEADTALSIDAKRNSVGVERARPFTEDELGDNRLCLDLEELAS